MAGILNNKERMLDILITAEGRRQASTGQLRVRYATFTDLHTFYEPSGSMQNIAAPADGRIFFEASSRIQDTVVPELLPGNSLRPFKASLFEVEGSQIASGTFQVGYTKIADVISGSNLTVSAAKHFPIELANNFRDLRILGTLDPFSDTSGFKTNISGSQQLFSVTNTTTFNRCPPGLYQPTDDSNFLVYNDEVYAESVPSLFRDRRFAHFPNFDYLPPINVPHANEPEGTPLGSYANLGEPPDLTIQEIEKRLEKKQFKKITFDDTSRDNNLVGQFFEFSLYEGFSKLSIVDAGEFPDGDPISPNKRVFYVGKMIKDSSGAETFFNIFTVIFD